MRKKIAITLVFVAGISLTLPGCFKSRADIARENEEREVRSTLQKSVYEQNEDLDDLRAQLGRIEGRIDVLEHNHKKEIGDIENGRGEAQKTLAELSQKVTEMQKNQEALFEEVKKIHEESLANAEAAKASPKGKKNSGISFEEALSAFQKKDYDNAADGFQTYLEQNAKGKKALEARYYLGESLFQLKEYSEAIAELGYVHERGMGNPLARKSTLRIAESFKAMGKDKDARAFAQILVEKSPSSAEGKAAKRFLK